MRETAAIPAPLAPIGVASPAAFSEVFVDPRDSARALRVSWHPETQTVVLSVWRRNRCVATHHLPAAEIGRLLQALGSL